MKSKKSQFIPLMLTFTTAVALCGVLYLFLTFLNILPLKQHIHLEFRPVDILVGMTIYLKTSIDFALFIGNTMRTNPGWKKRIAIEAGTALGNAVGTFVVLTIWFFFKEAPLLMLIMIFLAALVLLRMAEQGFSEFLRKRQFKSAKKLVTVMTRVLHVINQIPAPVMSRILPSKGMTKTKSLPFLSLLLVSFTVPFLLGLDDFAGYIPLFTIVNVFNFCIGVFLAHMLLNTALFASPDRTTKLVSHPLIILFGSTAFLGIGIWGFWEAIRILMEVFHFF